MIAFVAASLDILGGQGVQASTLLKALRQDGREVELVPINPRFPRPLAGLRQYPGLRTVANQLIYLPSLARLQNADVVHVFSASYWSFLLAVAPALLAARALGKRTILNYHSGEAPDHLARWGALVHPWLRLAHEIVVPSEFLRRVFARHGHRARVIPNVVDLDAFRRRERNPLTPRLLSIRNLEPHYRVDNTLEAFAILRERHPHAALTVAGYGSQEAALRRRAETLGGVSFLGRVEPDEVPALYERHDVFLNSSVVDNQPLSILEAFASGMPVVSTATGDIGAMLCGGDAGVIVPADDPQAMAAAIAGLLEQPERALALSRRAAREVERYSWDNVRDFWRAVYAR